MLLERSQLRADGRVRREVRALAAAGHDVLLLHHGPKEAEAALVADGARVRSVRPPGRAGNLLDRLPRRLRRPVLWGCYAWCATRARPDVVHAHDLPMLAPAWLAARTGRAALVYDTHEYAAGLPYHTPLARRLAGLLQRVLVPRCAAVIAVSEEAAEKLQRDHRLAIPPVVVRNVPTRSWEGAPGSRAPVTDLRAQLGLGAEPLVLHQGAAAPRRGCVQLVEAVAGLNGVHVLFLGDAEPDTGAAVRRAAGAHGVSGRVHLRSSVPLEVLLGHTEQADVGVCLSDPAWLNHRLTLSNKLFEYIAAGLPVVATRGTATGTLVERLGVGLTVAFGDRPALSAGIARMIRAREDPAFRERVAAAGRDLNWEREQDRLVEAYRRLPSRRFSRHVPRRTT